MAELQSRILNDVELTARVSDSDQIVQFVEASIREAAADVPDMSKLGLSYRSTEEEKKIALSYDGTELGSIDASDFVKDGMISDVSYDEATHVLSILWNSDGGSKVTTANLSGLLDTYTAGKGLTCENGEFSLTADIPSKASDLENDSGYATSAYVDGSCESLSSELTGWVEGQNYLTEHQSLSGYYAKSETSSAAEISGALAGKQPSGDYATSAYVNEGHGYSFQDHFSVTDLAEGGKAVNLSGVALESDVYMRGVFDACLSAVRQYDSPKKVPLSAVVNAIWCLSKLQEWVTPDEPEEEPAD